MAFVTAGNLLEIFFLGDSLQPDVDVVIAGLLLIGALFGHCLKHGLRLKLRRRCFFRTSWCHVKTKSCRWLPESSGSSTRFFPTGTKTMHFEYVILCFFGKGWHIKSDWDIFLTAPGHILEFFRESPVILAIRYNFK